MLTRLIQAALIAALAFPVMMPQSVLAAGETYFSEAYVIQRGDSLSKIARNELGDMARWKEIAELNHISNPNLIIAGEKLMLPSKMASLPATEVGDETALTAAPTTSEPAPLARIDTLFADKAIPPTAYFADVSQR